MGTGINSTNENLLDRVSQLEEKFQNYNVILRLTSSGTDMWYYGDSNVANFVGQLGKVLLKKIS